MVVNASTYHIVVRRINNKLVHGAWILGTWHAATEVSHEWIIKDIRKYIMQFFYAQFSKLYNIKIVHGAWINGVWNPAHYTHGHWEITNLMKMQRLLRISNKTLEDMYAKEEKEHLKIQSRWLNGKEVSGAWIDNKFYPAKLVDGNWVIEQIEIHEQHVNKVQTQQTTVNAKIVTRRINGKNQRGCWIKGKWNRAVFIDGHWVIETQEHIVERRETTVEQIEKFLHGAKYRILTRIVPGNKEIKGILHHGRWYTCFKSKGHWFVRTKAFETKSIDHIYAPSGLEIEERTINGKRSHGAFIEGKWFRAYKHNHNWMLGYSSVTHVSRKRGHTDIDNEPKVVKRTINGKVVMGAWIKGKWFVAHMIKGQWVVKDIETEVVTKVTNGGEVSISSKMVNGKKQYGAMIGGSWAPAKKVNGQWVIEQVSTQIEESKKFS